jgi:class 3 adenylate cyclase
VLFCDLVGSTEIAANLDPEEWRDMVAGYHRVAAEAITRYGGNVAKYLGDGVMAYFGWPEAHENDAERAARAGLAVLDEVARFNQESIYPKVSVRVGIDSGSVVVGAGAGKEADVFGEAPNIAARVQNAAAPDTLLLTASTHRLVSGLFVVEALGAQELKGVANPIELFRVLRSTGVRGRLAAARGLTPFVGRDEELRLLLSRWERVCQGDGQLVIVAGEAGIGKSRLVAEFHERIRDTPHIWMESAGEQLFENTPLHAVTEMLSQWLELQTGKNAGEGVEHLEKALASAGLKLDVAAPLIADLLQLPPGERYPALTLAPKQKRRRLLAVLAGWVFGAARLQPVVMVVEDLHWLDPSTLELLQLFAEQGATVPLMLLYTARPEFRASWPMRTHHSQITLSRLSLGNVREMVALVAARNALANESVEAVVKRTGGVPLFVEELTRAVLESGGARIRGGEIPATLHDSLMARLDRLGPAKEVVQIGAVIGTDFSYRLLHAVYPIPDEDLQRAILSATNAELVYVRGIPPDATYQFKHALIRDAAYEALLRSRRKDLHSRTAEILVEQFADRVTAAPELLAHHFTEAGLIEQAIPYWQRAGQDAVARSANTEAVSHLTKALELLKSGPDSSERVRRELALRVVLGVALISIKGYTAPEVVNTYSRALELCRQMGETPELFPVLLGLFAFRLVRAEYPMAHELGEQLLRLAQNVQDTGLIVNAHEALGHTFYFMGSFPQLANTVNKEWRFTNRKSIVLMCPASSRIRVSLVSRMGLVPYGSLATQIRP